MYIINIAYTQSSLVILLLLKMAKSLKMCACWVQQTSFYIQTSEPLSYKCLDYIDRSSSSVVKDLMRLAQQADISDLNRTTNVPSAATCTQQSAHRLLTCCASPDNTLCLCLEDLVKNTPVIDTLMDTGFSEEHSDLDESDISLLLQDTTLDTAFSEPCDTINSDTSVSFAENCHLATNDNASEKTDSTCGSTGHLVPQAPLSLRQKHTLASKLKKLAKHFR